MGFRVKKYKKRVFSMFVLAFLLVTSLFSSSTIAYGATTQKDALLIETNLPWGTNANSRVLDSIGASYDTVPVKKAITMDLSQYRVVIIANDQNSAAYKALNKFNSQLQTYVENGGTVIYGCCAGGWSSGSNYSTIIGGVKVIPLGVEKNDIVDSTSPIVTAIYSDNIPLLDSELTGSGTSHIYFDPSTLPSDTNIIFNTGNESQPTLVEFKLGKGKVIASGLTWEFSYVNTKYGVFSQKAFDDLYLYALRTTSSDVEDVPGMITSNVTLDKSVYQPDDLMNIKIVSEITANKRNAKAVIKVLDSFGYQKKKITETAEQSFTAGTPVTIQENWQVADLPDGSYKIVVEWFDKGTSVGTGEAAFSVKKAVVVEPEKAKLTNKITLSPTTATKSDSLTIKDKISNPTNTIIAKNLVVDYAIKKSDGGVVWTEKKNVAELMYQNSTTLSTVVPLTEFAPAEYTVTSTVSQDGTVMCSDSSKFTVIDDSVEINNENFTGILNVTVNNADKTANYSYRVNNISTIDAKNVGIYVKTEKLSDNKCIDNENKKADIKAGDSVKYTTKKDISDTTKWTAGNYKATLYLINSKNEEVELATKTFSIVQDYFGTGYSLFSTVGSVSLNGYKLNIDGQVYSNDKFTYQGSYLTINNTLSTPKTITINGSYKGTKIKEQVENAKKITLPDYSDTILESVDGYAVHKNYIDDMSKITDKVVVCNTLNSEWRPEVILKHTLIAKGNGLSLNAETITLGDKQPVVFSCLSGDVTFNTTNLNLNGLIYVPNGTVTINVCNMNLTGTIIAKKIVIAGVTEANCKVIK